MQVVHLDHWKLFEWINTNSVLGQYDLNAKNYLFNSENQSLFRSKTNNAVFNLKYQINHVASGMWSSQVLYKEYRAS